ncbi:MAG: nicotinamide-nucleotide amidohydrolase family protein [Treponema sp.]|nr:nicotinamide-nucleotide amidohydrolase family protein [Treponema sp.]
MLECNIDEELINRAEKTAKAVIEKLKSLSLKLVLAESCTAGLISSMLADIPGASGILWGSFACYTKDAKISMLGLEKNALDSCDLVSSETACLMAAGALLKSGADIAVSVTGLAGPDGDGSGVPVGTVWVAAALRSGGIDVREFHFSGARNENRIKAAIAVLDIIMEKI